MSETSQPQPGERIEASLIQAAWGSLEKREPEQIATEMLRHDLERFDSMFDILLDMFTLRRAVEEGFIGKEDEPADYNDVPEVYSVEYTREQQLEDIERIWDGLWMEMAVASEDYFAGDANEFKSGMEDVIYRLRETYAPRALTFWHDGRISI